MTAPEAAVARVDTVPGDLLPHEVVVRIGCGACKAECAGMYLMHGNRGERDTFVDNVTAALDLTGAEGEIRRGGMHKPFNEGCSGECPASDPEVADVITQELRV